ncbi:hypothetical protein AN958_04879 [Leucoagaricus sp. SymC.cos]|nr:hypothetical protein AN958_04879 [Leucoagaricus sp. SymC.cos]
MHSLGRNPSRPTSPTSPLPSSVAPIGPLTIPIPITRPSFDKSPILLDTPSTPQIKPSVPPSPENIPLPPSRPGSSRGPILLKKRRRSLDLDQLDGIDKTTLIARSRSLRITPISSLSRPSTPKSPAGWLEPPPETREPPAPPEAAHQHFLEVKRARKMTQLFGQELPQELIRVPDDRGRNEHTRRRANSTASSTLDSLPSTPTFERYTNLPDGENVMPTTPPTKPHADFQERRRRVAKLSQFFGVDHAEIASSLVFTKPDQHREESQKPVSISYGESTEVGVKVVSRRRWGLGEDMRDVELSDAINKLRSLKAN